MVRRRHFFHISGFDPISPEALHQRFRREFAIFLPTWHLNGSVGANAPAAERWSVSVTGPNWSTESTVEAFAWHDLIHSSTRDGMITRLARAWTAFANVTFSGALVRYFRAYTPYALFFLFPFANVVLFALAGLGIGIGIAAGLRLNGAVAWAVASAIALAAFFALLAWLGERWRVWHALDDWAFSAENAAGLQPAVAERLDVFAARLLDVVRAGGVDEIVLVGHSMGASFAIEVLSRALLREPEFARHGPGISLVTVGATIPKFSLHPQSNWIRDSMARVVREPSITWIEYHSRKDIISFHRFDPFALEKVRGNDFTRKPMIRFVQVQDMVTPETLRRISRTRMRLHYQFVMANDVRSAYDYFMLASGPLRLPEVVMASGGYTDFIAADGSLIEGRSSVAQA